MAQKLQSSLPVEGDLPEDGLAAFRNVFAAPEVQVVPATRRLWEDTARLRAATGLKTPDALHAATAQQDQCALFITNDADFRRVDGLPATILDDLLTD